MYGKFKVRWLVIAAALLLSPFSLDAQNLPVQSSCTLGGQQVQTQGINSTTRVQASYPRCTVIVYNHDSRVPTVIFGDQQGTGLSNPFTADANGSWAFFIPVNTVVDVVMNGGTPIAMPHGETLVGIHGGWGLGGISTGSGLPVTNNLLAGNGEGGAADSGIPPADAARLSLLNVFATDQEINGRLSVEGSIYGGTALLSQNIFHDTAATVAIGDPGYGFSSFDGAMKEWDPGNGFILSHGLTANSVISERWLLAKGDFPGISQSAGSASLAYTPAGSLTPHDALHLYASGTGTNVAGVSIGTQNAPGSSPVTFWQWLWCTAPDNATHTCQINGDLYVSGHIFQNQAVAGAAAPNARPGFDEPGKPLPAQPKQTVSVKPPKTPTSSKTACTPDDMWHDNDYLYVCVAQNQIKRVPLQNF